MSLSKVAKYLFLLISVVISSSVKSDDIEYLVAIDTKQWCWKFGSNRGLHAHFIKLNQIINGFATFTGEGNKFLIELSHLDRDVYENMKLVNAARYIGKVGNIGLKNLKGFEVEYEVFDVISRDQFLKTERRLGQYAGHCEMTIGELKNYDFRKVDKTGQAVAPNSQDWSCVADYKRKLMWEVKTLKNIDNLYSLSSVQQHVKDINDFGLCGSKKWRLPTQSELNTIIEGMGEDKYFNKNIFKLNTSAPYLTSSVNKYDLGVVDFKKLLSRIDSKLDKYHAILVYSMDSY